MSGEMVANLALGGIVGAALGAVHMLWLWRAAARFGAGGGAAGLLGGALLRLALVLAGTFVLMRLAGQPGAALAGALTGFTAIRLLAVRRARKG
ncbi:hypothetical protein [Acidimangrovimonas pyrenivorans]|uniref:ATP synthase subunit I n=1 Tax=Acidimangrovimonas pyrenivorans TaxID=2030798 RepID=A0ABV7AGE1_9RHOB